MGVEEERSDQVRQIVRGHYAAVARAAGACCAPRPGVSPAGCCSPRPAAGASGCCNPEPASGEEVSAASGAMDPGAAATQAADLGLGCGDPVSLAALQPGETVVDLGSGAGHDCLLAARLVGPGGHVIGVDMTPEMLSRARENARSAGCSWVEFRLGEIEHLPVADATADVVISNCVINLSPDKAAVFAEAFRVLRPGGRLAIADTLAVSVLPEELRNDPEAWSCCVGGAATADELDQWLKAAGFVDIRIERIESSRQQVRNWLPAAHADDYIVSASIHALKPGQSGEFGCC